MTFLLALIAVVTGALNTIQAGSNATLNKVVQAPIFTACVVSIAGLVVYLLAGLYLGYAVPSANRMGQVPWWGWVGGALGGLYVLAAIFLAQKLGSAVFTGLTVTAGIVTSVLLDHFGLVGFEQHSAGVWRILGCGLMIGGLALVSMF